MYSHCEYFPDGNLAPLYPAGLVEEKRRHLKTEIKEKHKGGRPKKDIKRDYTLSVRMTKMERLRIEGKAKKAGMKTTEWFRQAAKSAEVKPRLTPAEVKHLAMLAGLSNNLNQLTRLAHIKGITYILEALQKMLTDINKLVDKLFRGDGG